MDEWKKGIGYRDDIPGYRDCLCTGYANGGALAVIDREMKCFCRLTRATTA